MTREEAIDILMSANVWNDEERTAWEVLIPELAESEDEKVKKTIRQLLETARDAHSNTTLAKPFIDALAWLEKQKEQKHYWKPTETDVALFNKAVTTNKALTPTERAQLDIIRSKFGHCHAVNCSGMAQKEQKPEWSEEDEKMLRTIISDGRPWC